MKSDSVLILEDGHWFRGCSFAADVDSFGKIVFNTSLSGYQEILSDPSSAGQILTMTYPMIGNYGVNSKDAQSDKVHSVGLVVKKYVDRPSHYRSEMSLAEYLKKFNVPAIEGIDSRRLVITLRETGPMAAGIFIGKSYGNSLLKEVRSFASDSRDLTEGVTTRQHYQFSKNSNKKYRIAVIDFGVKRSTLQELDKVNFEVHVFPANTLAGDIVDFDAIFLSDGPKNLTLNSDQTKLLLELEKPIMAIGTAQQMIAYAKGGQIMKRNSAIQGGSSVREMTTGQVKMVNSNSMYCANISDVNDIVINFEDANSGSTQGFTNTESPIILAVNFSPEGAPGAQDTRHLYRDFHRLVEAYVNK